MLQRRLRKIEVPSGSGLSISRLLGPKNDGTDPEFESSSIFRNVAIY
jgi:hypothetical protein